MAMITSQQVYLASLNRLPIADIAQLPPIRAIYFAVEHNVVVYVGKTDNLRQRWPSHHRRADLSKDVYIAWQPVPSHYSAFEFAQFEHKFIHLFNPRLNNAPRQAKPIISQRSSVRNQYSQWSRLRDEWDECQALEREIMTTERATDDTLDSIQRSIRQYRQQLEALRDRRHEDHERLQAASERLRSHRKAFLH